jgi:hypothetical protein
MEAAANLHEDLPLGAPRDVPPRLPGNAPDSIGQGEGAPAGTRQGRGDRLADSRLHRAGGLVDHASLRRHPRLPGRRSRCQTRGESVPVVGDIKTGKTIYPEALLQVSAYVAALREMEHAPWRVWGAVVRLPKVESDPDVEIRLISPAEQEALFRTFLHVQALWNWQQASWRRATPRRSGRDDLCRRGM